MQTKEIKIFIASNKELNDDREVIRNAILSLNKEFESLKLSNIEFYDIPSYSNINTNYQSNINELILESDIFILLLHIRYGIFTIEELDFAIKNNKKIFAYFKGTISDELKNPIVLQEYVKTRELFEKLKNNNKIYPVEYDNRDKLINIIEKDLIFYLQNQYESINNYNLKFFTKPPPRPVELFGRDEDYKNLITAISKNNKVLLLNGIAGIGKTELTKKYFWDNCDKFKFIGWIDYLMGFRESLVSQFKDNIANITPEDDYNTRYKKITKFLTNNEDILLIIDNIDNEIEKDSELQLIRTLPKVTILATSRIKLEVIENKIDLDFLNDEACKELFYKYYNIEINDEFINKIIKFANNHTLTIELLAKTAKAINLPLEEFYNKLKNTGLSEVAKEKISTLYHNDPTKRQIFEHLLKAFQLSGLNDNERYILTNISILPSISTNKTYIKEWLGLESYDDINSLVTKGWINEIGFDVKIHPVIQEAIRGQTNPDFEKCKILINSIIKKLYNESGDNPLLKKEYILYAESILGYFERIKEENEDIATLANNLSTIYKDMGDLNQSLDFQLKVVEIFEKIFDKNHPSLATSYNNLSMIYQDMGDLNQSLDFQLKALEIREKIFDKNHPSLATSYNNLSAIYQDMGDLNQSLDFQLKALEIREKIFDKNHPDLAISYNNLSIIYQDMGDINQSLDFQLKALEIREKIFDKNHPDLATSYNNLSTIYQYMGDLNQSLDFQLKALEIREKIFDKNHPSLAISYNNLSLIYQDMGNLNQSLDFQLKALEIREKIFDKNHPDLAISYSILSLIYQDMGDLNQSLDFQLKALEIEEKILNHSNLAKSYQNLSSIYLDMDKIKDSLDYLKKSIEISINNNKIEKETLNIYELLQKKQKNDIIKPILIYYFAKIKENKRKYNNSIKYYNKISNNETKDTQNVFNLFIDKITIKDFFCIKELEIDNLSDKKEIYFLGENGDGKTILLQAIILSLKYTKDIGIFTDFVNDNPQETTHISTKIKNDNFENVLDFYYTKNIQESKNYLIYDELLKSKMFLTQNVFAYGGNRNKNDSNKKDDKGFLTLFSPEQYLTSPEEWLKSIYIKEKFGGSNVISLEIAKKILIEIIGQDEESKSNIEIDVNHERVIFKERGTIVKFVQLSDGYKIVLIWICDLLQRLATNNPNAKKTTDFQGIVLVDEIELFLHPKWAYKIVRDLRRWFPNIQFIFTTHSPEVVLGSSKDAVFYRLYKEDSYTKIQKPFEDISNYMANVILTSPLFGLKTARPASNENTYALDTNDDYISSKIHKKIDEFIKQKKYYDSIDIDKIIEEELSKIDKQ